MSATRGSRASAAGLITLAALVWSSAAASCGGEDECEFDAITRSVGGVGLMDCGIASIEDTSTVDDCAVSAYQANHTFRAIYEQDDGGLEALVHAAGGTYHLIRLSGEDDSITRADCDGATFTQESGRRYIVCDDPEPFRAACE
jgi:hypothetical protein